MQKSIKRLAEIIHVLSACWVLVIAAIILIDVLGRYFFNAPFLGAVEIIKNSVVSITFLQLPLAIYTGGMLRTTLLYGAVGPTWQRVLRTLTGILGFLFFWVLPIVPGPHFWKRLRLMNMRGRGLCGFPPIRFACLSFLHRFSRASSIFI